MYTSNVYEAVSINLYPNYENSIYFREQIFFNVQLFFENALNSVLNINPTDQTLYSEIFKSFHYFKHYNSAKNYRPINGIIDSSIALNDFLFTINIVLGYTKY